MERRLRVLYVVDKMTVGGAQTHLDTVVRSLSPFGVDADLCCLQEEGPLGARLRRDGHSVARLGLRRVLNVDGLRAISRLRKRITYNRYDLVHSYLFSSNLVAPIAARLAGVPAITSRRDTGFWAAPRHLAATRFANRFTAAITVNSEAVRQVTLDRERVNPGKVHLIHNGVRPARRERNGRFGVVGTLGNLSPVKGHACLLRAFAQVSRRHDRLALRIYGDGPERRRLECTAGAMGLGDRVAFVPGRSAVESLGEIDLFVLPSLSEGCSNALLEAMSAGLPVVASDIPANREVIRDGVDGLLTPVADSTALAAAMSGLIESPARREALGTAAAAVTERYSIETMLTKMRDLYLRVVEKVGGSAR